MNKNLVAKLAILTCLYAGSAAAQTPVTDQSIASPLELAEELAALGRARGGNPELLVAAAVLARDNPVLRIFAEGAEPVCSFTQGPAAPGTLLIDALRFAEIGDQYRYLIPRIQQLQANRVAPDCSATRGSSRLPREQTVEVRRRGTAMVRVPASDAADGRSLIRAASSASSPGLTFQTRSDACSRRQISGLCSFSSPTRAQEQVVITNETASDASVTVRW